MELIGHFIMTYEDIFITANAVQCVVLVLFLVGSSIKDVGKLEGRDQNSLKVADGKK